MSSPDPIVPVAWATVADVKAAAGLAPADTTDDDWLAAVTDAANSWCYDQRAAAGYDDPGEPGAPAPNARAHTGTVLYALGVYRERGTNGGAAGYEELGSFEPPGPTLARVRQLLGVPRPVFG